MIKFSDLVGQDAIALGSATTTGKVKGLRLARGRVTAVYLSDSVIEADAVRSFEGDVLTYDDKSVVSHGEGAGGDPRKMPVLDMHGDEIGTIADLEIAADGHVESILLADGNTIAGYRLRVIGTFAAILSDDLPPPVGPHA